jgi:simple sugar transport system permease protein
MIRLVLEPRLAPPATRRWVGVGVAAGAAATTGAAVFLLAGADPIAAYAVMARGAFGSLHDLSEVAVKATPLMLCGLAVAVAARMQLWNVGAEGQLVLGGIAAAGVALYLAPYVPSAILLPTMVVAAWALGGLWGGVAGLLKAKLDVSEILTSLMLNYVAILWLEHLYFGPWRDPRGMGFPGTAMLPDAAWLPRLPGTRIHLGLVLALAGALLFHWLLAHTRWGFEIRVAGDNPRAAAYAGMPVRSLTVWVLFVSGGLAGLAGMAEVSGIHYRLQQGLAVGYGYTGIIVAWLGRLHPAGVPLAALGVAALLVGGDQLQTAMHLPSSAGLVLEGTLFFSVLAGEFASRYRLRWRGARPC